jgi:hypothetical protein
MDFMIQIIIMATGLPISHYNVQTDEIKMSLILKAINWLKQLPVNGSMLGLDQV